MARARCGAGTASASADRRWVEAGRRWVWGEARFGPAQEAAARITASCRRGSRTAGPGAWRWPCWASRGSPSSFRCSGARCTFPPTSAIPTSGHRRTSPPHRTRRTLTRSTPSTPTTSTSASSSGPAIYRSGTPHASSACPTQRTSRWGRSIHRTGSSLPVTSRWSERSSGRPACSPPCSLPTGSSGSCTCTPWRRPEVRSCGRSAGSCRTGPPGIRCWEPRSGCPSPSEASRWRSREGPGRAYRWRGSRWASASWPGTPRSPTTSGWRPGYGA